ncbi:ATP-dependent RNA helicase DDX24 [Cloeon dipterum]|uniref:ATP-dependent RNA helicase DDX24 n=1 Tax=Cloeon dipterum TaxID=197152 RepID=UPI00322054DC
MGKKRGRGKGQEWKPVQANDLFLEGTNCDGLIGIEELSDYNIESFKKPKFKKQSEDGADRKRSLVETSAEEVVLPDNESAPKKKKKASKNNSGTKNGWGVTNIVEEETDLDMSAWDNLFVPEPVLTRLKELGFTEPTRIQLMTLPPATAGRKDILGAAETGSGKTLAFGIPIISRILDYRDKFEHFVGIINEDNEAEDSVSDEEEEVVEDDGKIGCVKVETTKTITNADRKMGKLHALILEPTRELAIQVKNHLVAVSKYCNIKIATVVGGMAQEKQERELKKCPEIVVATPGRLWELIKEGNPFLQQVDRLTCLVIDEADRMMERGHFQELGDLIERLELSKCARQTLVFSATLTLVHEPPKRLSVNKKKKKGPKQPLRVTPGQKLNQFISMLGLKNPKVIDLTAKEGTAESLTEAYIPCRLEEKDALLYIFLKNHPGRTLVFLNSISSVRRLANVFTLLKCSPVALHAQMIQKQRLKSLEKFSSNPTGLLLATDVAARGLDIVGVQHVIHYHVPRTSENYVHRSGRTARAHKEGLTVLFVEPQEMSGFNRMCQNLGKHNDLPEFPVDRNMLDEVKKRVELAKELEQLDHSHRRSYSDEGWLKKAAKELDLHFDEHDRLPLRAPVDPSAERALKLKKKSLEALLRAPLNSKGFSGKYPTSTGALVVPFTSGSSGEALNMVKSKSPGMKSLGQELGIKKKRRPRFNKKKKVKEGI